MRGFKKRTRALTNIKSCQCSPVSDFKALPNLGSTIALPLIFTGSTKQTNKEVNYSFDSLPPLNDVASKSDLVLWHCSDSLTFCFQEK